MQPDQYAGETSWEIYNSDGDIVAINPEYSSNVYQETIVSLDTGFYNLVVNDSFGDGICCDFGEGWFGVSNDCGLNNYIYDFNSAQAVLGFSLNECSLPVQGCMDFEAYNFDPNATIESPVCEYEVTFKLDLNGPHPPIEVPEINGEFNGWCGNCWAMSDDNDDGEWEFSAIVLEGTYLWKFSADTWLQQELPVGVSESPCFLFDANGYVNRTLVVDGNITLPPFCWESCLPCGAIVGCTNPEATNWNPWANFDEGCNVVESANCELGFTELSVTILPDNYPSETSWNLIDNNSGLYIHQVPVGSYANAPVGIPITTNVCALVGSSVTFELNDTYGDGLNGAIWGGQDGGAMVTACSETLFLLEPSMVDFNYGISSTFNSPICEQVDDVFGCTDENYVEYNSNAIVSIPAMCLTEKVYGCIDEAYFNYNELANTENQIDSCFYTLTITDGVGDGWFGSWVGIYQNGWISPEYQMGPNDGNIESFDIYLSSEEEIGLYFFTTPQSQLSAAQCGFMLEGPTGDTLLHVNQWDAIPFPYTYNVAPYCGNSCEPFMYGCIDVTAQNYSQTSNTSDESCYYAAGCTQAGYLEYYTQGYEADYDNGDCNELAVFGCMETNAYNYNLEANVATECIPVIIGCMNSLAYNYDVNANTDGDCVPYIYGCTDPTMFNYDTEANTEDGSCTPYVYGCTDSYAFNYDPLANSDNGSCLEVVEGCADPQAWNYEPLVNISNSLLCLYDAGCIGDPGQPYWANDECYSWVIDVDPYCCNTSWDSSCVELYVYCGGDVTSVGEIDIACRVFPNPTQGVLNIKSPYNVTTTLYDMLGNQVLPTTTETLLRLDNLSNGMYEVRVQYNDRIVNTKIIKQ